VASSNLVEIITDVSSQFVVLLFGIVLFLLLVGSFFKEEPHGVFLEGGWKTTFMIIVFLGLTFIFLDALDLLQDTFDFLEGTSKGEFVGSVILIIMIVLFMVFITQERQSPKKSP
jgi:Ca2+/Na+ antiporter